MADNSQPESPLRLILQNAGLWPGGIVYAQFLRKDYIVVSFWTLQHCRTELNAWRTMHQAVTPEQMESIIEEARAYGIPETRPSCMSRIR